jgi:hypothetical protein
MAVKAAHWLERLAHLCRVATEGAVVPFIDHVAIVSLTSEVSIQSLLTASAAVQKQVTRDFTPIWGLPATVDAFDDLSSVPSDYHPVVLFADAQELIGRIESSVGPAAAAELVDDFERGGLSGLHLNAFTRQPFALVQASADEPWTVTLSHEILEMLADPYGNRLIAAVRLGEDQQRVKYLVEICDPCQTQWYPVNGIPVSDFYTPRFFDPVCIEGIRYSFTGALKRPLDIVEGGYLTWIDPRDSALYQLRGGESVPVRLLDLTALVSSRAPLRTVVDTNPQTPRITLESLRAAESADAADAPYVAINEAAEGASLRMREALFSLAAELG